MGFFDVILKSIGFDVDDGEKKQKKAKKQKTEVAQKPQMSAKFNLSKPQQPEVKVEQKQEEQQRIVAELLTSQEKDLPQLSTFQISQTPKWKKHLIF